MAVADQAGRSLQKASDVSSSDRERRVDAAEGRRERGRTHHDSSVEQVALGRDVEDVARVGDVGDALRDRLELLSANAVRLAVLRGERERDKVRVRASTEGSTVCEMGRQGRTLTCISVSFRTSLTMCVEPCMSAMSSVLKAASALARAYCCGRAHRVHVSSGRRARTRERGERRLGAP